MADDQGATPRELLLEACRRDNTELLSELLADITKAASNKQQSPVDQIAELLNNSTDGIGSYCLHIAATNGSYEVLDMLLDQEGLEVDPRDRLEEDTPLHKSVRFVNGLSNEEWENGKIIVELLLDAGADPRIRNKAKLKPFELVDPRNTELRSILQNAEFTTMAGDDVVDQDADTEDGPTGSASDSD